jgi:hypothetical protein
LETIIQPNQSYLSDGVKSMMISTLSFAMMNVFIKQLSHLPAMEVVFFQLFDFDGSLLYWAPFDESQHSRQ